MATDPGSYNPVTDPDFLKAPIPQQHAYLMATDKDYAAGQPRERTAYLEHINSMNQEPLADLQAETNKTLPAVPGLREGARNVAGGLRKLAGAVLNPETGERYKSLEDFQRQARLHGTPGEIAKQGLESIPFVGPAVRAARGLSNLKTAAEGQEAAGELAGQIATLGGSKAPEAARAGMRGAGRAMEAVNKPLTPRTYKGFNVTPATLAGAAGGAAVTPGPWYLKAFGGVPAGMAVGERLGRSIAGAGTRLREAGAEPPEVMPPLRGLPFPRTMPGETEFTPGESSVRGAPAVPPEPTTRAQRMGLLLPEGPAPEPPPGAPEVRGTYEPTTRAQRLGLLLPQGAERVLVTPQEAREPFIPPPEVNMQEAQVKGVERPIPARIGRAGRVEVQPAAGESPEAAVQRAVAEARARAPKPQEPLAGWATNAPGSTKTKGATPAPAEPPVRGQGGRPAKGSLPLMTPAEIAQPVLGPAPEPTPEGMRPNPNVVVGKGAPNRAMSNPERGRRILAGMTPDYQRPAAGPAGELQAPLPVQPAGESLEDQLRASIEAQKGKTRGTERGKPEGREVQKQAGSVAESGGNKTSVLIPGSDEQISARYKLVDLADIKASHSGISFAPNEDYGLTNQRDYTNPVNQGKVLYWSGDRFDPRYHVTDNPDAVNGPPVVDRSGNAVGGNGRKMILERVYQYNEAGANSYRAALRDKAGQFGYKPADVDKMKQPVLVREIDDPDFSKADAQRIVSDLNKVGTAERTPTERAISDSQRVSPATLKFLNDQFGKAGEDARMSDILAGRAGHEVLDRLIQDGVISPQEQAALRSEEGLTAEAKDRISRIVIGKFFDSPGQLDNTPASIRGKLERMAAPLGAAATVQGWDITPTVREAVGILEASRATGLTIDDLFRQRNLGGTIPQASPEAILMAKSLKANGLLQMQNAAKSFAKDAHDSTGMFGSSVQRGAAYEAAFKAVEKKRR